MTEHSPIIRVFGVLFMCLRQLAKLSKNVAGTAPICW
jgi:hypothetical protein